MRKQHQSRKVRRNRTIKPGKKISGIKRCIAVDSQNFPHAVAGATAEVTDRKETKQALGRSRAAFAWIQSALCGAGYMGKPVGS
jgi:hypothetical protein